ncbi:MAG: amidohydrolase family protein [Acidobacteria bacterium]|nr:amidohydrolase family protein [Acidobacteriota bacterium]MYE42693.1 amidohydrolase family protein [Acidobacteriota bacterium]
MTPKMTPTGRFRLMHSRLRRRSGALFLVLLLFPAALFAQDRDLDLVVTGGRVIDPETGLDAVRDVGVVRNEIVAISREVLQNRLKQGGVLLDASGKVVSPGFIDLHVHGQSLEANRFQAMDGVTTALELEGGVPSMARFIESRTGNAIVHYGASASHGGLRLLGVPGVAEQVAPIFDAESTGAELVLEHANMLRHGNYAGVEDTGAVHAAIAAEMRAGALGIGMPHQYYPGADHTEIFHIFELAAELDVPIYCHVRDMTIAAIQEVISNATATGASLHIVHLNSSSLHHLPVNLALIKGARDAGVDVTTEAYPYTAASTGISSAIFDEGWQEKLGMTYGDIQWQDTGERLTEETFNFFQEEGGTVIMHMMDPEMIELAMRTPFVMVASDGMPYAPGAHPRTAGTFSRVLGRYVRDWGVMTLNDALRRMTLMPAQRLQEVAPLMRRKGRIQLGAIADITVFDPDTIIDTATFEDDLTFSEGVTHVVVDGVPVVRDGALIEGVFPGKPLLSRYTSE